MSEKVSIMSAALLATERFDKLVELATSDAGQNRVNQWLTAQRLHGSCRIGVIGVLDDKNSRLMAMAKVILPGKGNFIHEEPYIEFPSEHFKTKVILAAG